MIILDEESKAVQLDNIHVATISSHFWTYDFKMLDYKLSPLTVLEESKTPVMVLEVNGFQFTVPCKWNIMVSDDETSHVDLVDIATLAGRDFPVLAFDHVRNRVFNVKAKVVDYKTEGIVVAPTIHRHELLCHPISSTAWINLAPTDMLIKYIREMVIGDLF